jgi:hypothetical protein
VRTPTSGGTSLHFLEIRECADWVWCRPERWTDGSVGEKTKSMPGVWGNVLSFLGGSHACIGYKFSLYECVGHAVVCRARR